MRGLVLAKNTDDIESVLRKSLGLEAFDEVLPEKDLILAAFKRADELSNAPDETG